MAGIVLERYEELLREAEKRLAERQEEKTIRIQVGSATCEHAAGAELVLRELKKHIDASERKDIVLRRTGCTGRCSREPIVGVFFPGRLPVKYERVDTESVHEIFTSHVLGGKPLEKKLLDGTAEVSSEYHVLFCDGMRCSRHMEQDLRSLFREKLDQAGLGEDRVRMIPANCFGLCSHARGGDATHVLIRPGKVLYRLQTADDVNEVIEKHFIQGEVVERLLVSQAPISQGFFDLYGELSFFNRQSRIALRNAGVIDPGSLDEYLSFRGFRALTEVLERNDPEWLIQQIRISNLRGRGGGGYPTGTKWTNGRKAPNEPKYIICNADEGDPGAFMDRSMLESDPFSVVEGMIIGAFAIGAHEGFFYIRAEYPLAIRRIEFALGECRKHGLLGKNILGSGFDLDLEIRLGAGAFVCGEETALIHSIEGLRGQPRIRPPYPSQSGLWGLPTVINNVETFANVSAILLYGAEWFRSLGTPKSGGTKVFALAGKVCHTGLVEVPMGTTLREVVFEIGGGVPGGKKIKAVQTGGPAGGCIPAKFLDTIVDFDSLTQVGSIMGSGGMIVLDEDDCMVDVAKFFMAFSQDESCGKCTPCREGTKRLLEILERITSGKGVPEDLKKLKRLALLVKRSSLCGLGRAAPNPILSTLEYFPEEYEAHVRDRKCPAHKCVALLHYEIDPEKCVGCTLCARNCPVVCISGERKTPHVIDQSRCIKCGRCFEVCRFDAVKKQ